MSTKIDSENSISRFDLLVSKPHVFKETVLYSTEKKWRPQFLSFFYLHNGSTEKPKIVGFMQILRRLRNESLFNLHDSKFKGFSSTFAPIKRIMEKSVDVKLAIFVDTMIEKRFPSFIYIRKSSLQENMRLSKLCTLTIPHKKLEKKTVSQLCLILRLFSDCSRNSSSLWGWPATTVSHWLSRNLFSITLHGNQIN